ncbi:MAG: hypothetical protein EON48_00660 [Acetobacteraceae bacterium]|nr:MAG: hypothetical protein EON48_00660 [Acetobacteraceae bacterium]
MNRLYPFAVLASAVGCLLLFVGLLAVLDRTGHLPPPALTNSICTDEKLANMRSHPPQDPNFLVIGSSVAWRHFDSAALVRHDTAAKPYNGGFCGLAMHQTGFAAHWLLDRFPTVREVLLIAVPQDFEHCGKEPAALFNVSDVDAYLASKRWPALFYLRYFDPFSLTRNASGIAAMRSGSDLRDPMLFTQFGDGPLDPGPQGGLGYGAVPKLDGACFAVLRQLAQQLAAQQRQLIVAMTPMNPDWSRSFDPSGQTVKDFADGLRQAVAGTSATVWDGNQNTHFQAADFSDGFHLRWASARIFSERLIQGAIRPGGRKNGETVSLTSVSQTSVLIP